MKIVENLDYFRKLFNEIVNYRDRKMAELFIKQ